MTLVSAAARSLFAAFTWRSLLLALALALALAVLCATALNPFFMTPFPVVLGRLVVIALLLVLAFTLARVWQPPGVPRWLAQVLAVVLTAPLATLIVYLPSLGANAIDVWEHDGRLLGFGLITGVTLVIAPLLALGALYRERDAQARLQAMQFELDRSTLAAQALDARLRLLHAQIEPHFLFNTLANVQALVESGSPRAAPVLKCLIAYLRAAMPQLDGDHATLGSEAALVRSYLELMHMRMPDRLTFAVDLPTELSGSRFPSMALLTLVENAIQHGIDPAEQGGHISVSARRDDAAGTVRVRVADSGVGMAETAAPGTGLTNLRNRLQAFFGPRSRLELAMNAPHGVLADIVIDATAAGAGS